MLTYKCRVIDQSGNIKEVIQNAVDPLDLQREITAQGLTLLSSKKGSSYGIQLRSKDILSFTQTLTLLLNSNLSLIDSLEISLTTFKDKRIKDFSELIIKGLKKGESFSRLLSENAVGFTPLYIGLIRVGEKTGTLNSVLQQLYNYLDRNKKFKDKLVGALIYPIFIISMTFLFGILFVVVLLPKFNEMFSTLGGGVGDIIEKRGEVLTLVVLVLSVLLLILFAIVLYINTIKKQDYSKAAAFEKYYLKIPLLGNLLLENETLNLLFALSVLSKSSLSIEESLNQGKEVLNNSFLKIEVESIRNKTLSGEPLSASFHNNIFPEKIPSFIKVGEKTGDITQIFSQLTDYYLKETDKKIDRIMSIIDPLFTLLIGSLLFSLILLFILPVLTKMGDLL